MPEPYLSVIIPAYNEAKRIPATLIDIDKKLSAVDYPYEILVVNDGSKDNTAEVVGKMASAIRNLTLIDKFAKMVPYFQKGDDVVIGSRAVKGSRLNVAQPFYRQLPGKIGNLIIQLLVLPGIWDTQCGFKAFTAGAAQRIFSLSRIPGWGFDVEALALARKFGFRIKEVPITWVNDPFSHVTASAYIKVLLETLTIRWWLWTGAYRKKASQ